jgi:CHAT domain-containing protein
LDFLAAELNLNLGANGVASGDYATAIDAYARALRQFLNMGLEEAATNCLVRIDDLASRQGPDIGREVVRGLAPLIQALENKLGEPAERLIQHTCKQALAGMGQKKVNPEVPFFLFQIAKGLRFAKALYAGSRYRWREDARGEALLQQIQKARSELPANSPILIPPNPEALLGENSLLTSYSSTSVGKYGSEAEERLVNLQQTYDRYLYQRLLASTESEEVLYFSSRDIQSAIDERTVLLDYYIGATPNGTVGLSLIVLTRDDYRISVISYNDVPDMTVFMGDSQTKVEVNPLALRVEELRNEIQKDPGKDLVTQEAAKTLEFNLIGYLGPFIEYLDQLNKQGKDHLLIIPHGPLHYFPFHLLGKPGKPLADNWKITYLPNLHLLTSSRGAPAVRRFRERTITAFGLSFVTNNPFKLKPPLPEATKESKAIAGVFGAEPLNEDDATETNFVNSLKNSRFVHLATHGRQNVNAPAFHCVFLSPDAQSDGVLYAHELLSQDLRGLEVLTLSACETALGRFDAGDNLRGLPASFLLAGVSTLIGTLWSVETCCAEYFFEKLYRELKNGASRLDAFAVAQSETRKAFPQYRDWGAFYFIGDWI